jgi:cysteine-rich repeat protein
MHIIKHVGILAVVLSMSCGDQVIVREIQGKCGNEQTETGEACDDGNTDNADACTNACEIARCGDAVTRVDLSPNHDDNEQCDDGNDVSHDACRTNCRAAVCGDGVTRMDLSEGEAGFEACDDGNADNTDGCTNACQSGADRDGDGVIDQEDNCPDDANPDQADSDGDDAGDVCDDEPNVRNFRLRSSAPLVLTHNGASNDQKLNGRLAGQNQTQTTGNRFKLKGGLHVQPNP